MKRIILLILVTFILLPSLKAAETLIFSDDFASSLENWSLESGWSVILEGRNYILQGTQHSFVNAYLDGTAKALEAKVKLIKGSIHLNIRTRYEAAGQSRYLIGFNEGGSYLQKEVIGKITHLKDGYGISLSEWHNIKIEIIGNRIDVFVDGRLVLSAQDKDLLNEGGISFETLENSIAYIDDVKVETSVPETRKFNAQELFSNGEHKGDITLEGRDSLILENGEFEQFGNVYLKDSSKLVIKDSTLKITRYQKLLNHWGIYLEDRASLEIENSKLLPGESQEGGTLFVIDAGGNSKVNMKNSPTKIHLFTMFDNAEGVVENSEIVFEIGGLVGAFDKGDVKVINSKIGAVNLHIPSGASFEASNLGTGFFEKWNLHENTKSSGINYNITLINTELIKDTIGPGPFERGWPVFIESDANVNIKDSELRKVVITLRNEKAEFANFYLEKPTDFNYRNISFENVKVIGQWGIFLHDNSDVIVKDSDAFWTFIYDDSKLTLINTHMNEFDPRNFHGEIIFENSNWDTAAEIIENNDFTMKGSLDIDNIGGFSWEDSKVTRVYDVVGKPNTELTLKKVEEIVWQGKADDNGKASFSIKFDDLTFNDVFELKDSLNRKVEVTFFSATPLNLEESVISRFISKIKHQEPPPQTKFIVLIGILVAMAIIIFALRKKFQRKEK